MASLRTAGPKHHLKSFNINLKLCSHVLVFSGKQVSLMSTFWKFSMLSIPIKNLFPYLFERRQMSYWIWRRTTLSAIYNLCNMACVTLDCLLIFCWARNLSWAIPLANDSGRQNWDPPCSAPPSHKTSRFSDGPLIPPGIYSVVLCLGPYSHWAAQCCLNPLLYII